MTLQELKKMIAEEYTAYKKSINEQPDMPEMPGVAVSDNDIDATGGGNAEATLKDIYEMLKDFFEGDDKPAAKDDKPLDPDMPAMPDIPGLDLKEAFKKRKLSRKRKGVKRTVMVERFKKLANIIK